MLACLGLTKNFFFLDCFILYSVVRLLFFSFIFRFQRLCFALLCSAVNLYDWKFACAFLAMHIHSHSVSVYGCECGCKRFTTSFHTFIRSNVRSFVCSFHFAPQLAHRFNFVIFAVCFTLFPLSPSLSLHLSVYSWIANKIQKLNRIARFSLFAWCKYICVCVSLLAYCSTATLGVCVNADRYAKAFSYVHHSFSLCVFSIHFAIILHYTRIAIVLWHTHHLRSHRIALHEMKWKNTRALKTSVPNSWNVIKRYWPHTRSIHTAHIHVEWCKRVQLAYHHRTNILKASYNNKIITIM